MFLSCIFQIAKNKGLTPKRKKELRNPRVKHRMKYRKAKIRRKGQVRKMIHHHSPWDRGSIILLFYTPPPFTWVYIIITSVLTSVGSPQWIIIYQSLKLLCDQIKMQLDVDMSPPANIMTFRLTLTHVSFDLDPCDPWPLICNSTCLSNDHQGRPWVHPCALSDQISWP